MSSLIPSSPEATMTSIELVEFINQDRSTSVSAETFSVLSHSDFCKKAKIVIGEGIGKFSDTYQNPQNNQFYPIYRFPKREACLMAMSYSYDLQAKVFDRMTALEQDSMPSFIVPTTLSGALRLAAEQAEVIEHQAAELAAAAPAVEFVGRYVDSTGSKGFRQVCKLLKVKEPDFRLFLEEKSIMYRLGGEWTAHSQHIDSGRFVVKAGTSDVSGHAFNSARFTPKGISWVAGEYAKYKLEK